MTLSSTRCGAVRVLEVDPDLAEGLPDDQREEATHALVAPAVTIGRGEWVPSATDDRPDGRVGVLILSGLLTREIAIGETVSAELLGSGDVIRPWESAADEALVAHDVRWRVIEEARLALLGPHFAHTAARWPTLTGALVARTMRRSEALALATAIACTTGLETRLLMLFWHLADRWGKVTSDGVVVPASLTHETIARIVGARRPSISTALKQLERDGRLLRAHRGGWMLTGDPIASSPVTTAITAA